MEKKEPRNGRYTKDEPRKWRVKSKTGGTVYAIKVQGFIPEPEPVIKYGATGEVLEVYQGGPRKGGRMSKEKLIKSITGYINYKVWEYVNKFKERHRQLKLREYLIDGAKLAAYKHIESNPDTNYVELKEIVIQEMRDLRTLAEGEAPPFWYDPDSVKSILPKKQLPAFYMLIDGCKQGKKPKIKEMAETLGVATKTISRWLEAWSETPVIEDIIERAYRRNEAIKKPVFGKARFKYPDSDHMNQHYGTSLKHDKRKTAL